MSEVSVNPPLFRLRAFEEEWLEPLIESVDAETPLDEVLLVEAERWLALGKAVGYFADRPLWTQRAQRAEAPSVTPLADWIRSRPAPPGLDAAGFDRALSHAREDLTTQRRELLCLVLFAPDDEWAQSIDELREFVRLVGRKQVPPPPPAMIDRVAWALEGALSDDNEDLDPLDVKLPAGWRLGSLARLAACSTTAAGRLAAVAAARAAVAKATKVLHSRQASIFISYRHDDSWAYASLLAKELTGRLGSARVFRDMNMKRGVDIPNQISEAINSCDVLLAVIGENWLGAHDRAGRRRLDLPRDMVALEIATALERGIHVIPVLVAGASMPDEADLPERLARLSRCLGLKLDHQSWDNQISAFIEELKRLFESLPDEDSPIPPATVPPMVTRVRQHALDEIKGYIARRTHVVIGGPPGIGKTWLLNALRAAHPALFPHFPEAVHVRLEEGNTEAMRELRLALHGHYGPGEFPLDDEGGIDALRRTVPANTLLLVDNADERESVEAVLRLARFLENVTVVVTSRRAPEFRDFRRLKLLRLPTPDAEAIVSEYRLDDATRADVLRKGDGNPLMLRVHADAARHGGYLDEKEAPLRSMLERWPADEERALWIIAELPSSILAQDLLVEFGGLTHAGMALLRDNALVEPVMSAPVKRPSLLELHQTLRLACQQRLPTVPGHEQRKLRADAARYYIGWLRSRPAIEAIDMARHNLIHLMHAVDEPDLRAELALALIGDHLDDPDGYLPSRGLAVLLVESELRSKLEHTAALVQGLPAAQILKNLGLFCHWANDPGAELLLLSASELYNGLRDEEGSAATAWILGIVAEDTGHYAAAERLYRAPLSALSDSSTQAVRHHLMGCSLYHQERFAEARAEFERAKDHAQAPAMRVRIDRRLAYVELADGDTRQALEQLKDVRERSKQLKRPRDAARCMRHIGQGQLQLGELEAADETLEQARKEFEQLGDQHGLGATLCALATTRRRRGRGEAWALAKQSRTIARGQPDEPTVPMRSPVGVARAEEELSEIAQAAGDGEAAIGHLRRACNIFEAINHPRYKDLAKRLRGRRDAPIPMPRGIVFDLVDTLAATRPKAYEHVKRQISHALDVDHARFKAAWAHSREQASTDSQWTPADRIRWVARELGAELTPQQTDQLAEHELLLWTSSVEIDPETRGVLAELREGGLEMVLVTNGSSAMRDLPNRLGLTPLLRASLLSCEVGVLKPRPGIYLEALERLGLPPGDCIYVGDGSDRELEGAKAVGLFAVRMLARAKPPYSTRESLDWDATVHSLGELVQRMGEDRA